MVKTSDIYSAFTETGATQTLNQMNQSDGRTETKESNIVKTSQSNVRYKTKKSQLVLCDAYATSVSSSNR